MVAVYMAGALLTLPVLSWFVMDSAMPGLALWGIILNAVMINAIANGMDTPRRPDSPPTESAPPTVRQAGPTLTDADWRWLGMEPPAQIPPPAKRLEGPR